MRLAPSASLLVLVLAGCDPAPPEGDGGSCPLEVVIERSSAGAFVPVEDGEDAELLLGFQGFRMLRFAIAARGASAEDAEVSAYVTVADTGVELGQRTRERAVAIDGGFRVVEWLVFFNDEPPSRVVGYDAEVEAIVRAAGCTGAARVRVRVRDDEACVDPDILLDAGALDAGLADAATCEGP